MSEEKQCKCCQELWREYDLKDGLCPCCYDYVQSLQKQINQLKQRLENLKSKLREANRVNNKNKFFEEKNKEKREKDNKLLEETMASNSKLNLENIVLKQQFEEKDKEIELYYNFLCNIADLTKTDVETLLFTNGNIITQNQTQLAIQELEKLKDLLLIENKNNPIVYDLNDYTRGGALDRDKTFEIIDQQIKELKGEKDVTS